jgi:hypothetical protein
MLKAKAVKAAPAVAVEEVAAGRLTTSYRKEQLQQ